MIISAINAMTLTPSRAVSIFQTEEPGGGTGSRQARKRPCPGGSSAIVGGLLTVWLAPRFLLGPGLPTAGRGAECSSKWLHWGRLTFVPGLWSAGVVGWFIIGPVNAVLGWIFRSFNRVFDSITAVYGWAVGEVLRLSAIVMVVYVGLLGLTGWRVATAPDRLHPHPGPGLSARQRPVARLRLGATDRGDHGRSTRSPAAIPDDGTPSRHPGRGPHGRHLRAVVPHDHQRLEPRHDVRRP